MKRWLPNLIGFQLVWMAAVGGAAQGWWWAGPAVLLVFAIAQLAVTRSRASDVRLMAFCAILGLALDSLWVQAGFMKFAAPLPDPRLAPIWIVAMWVGFGLTVNHSLSGLKPLPWLGALLGLLGGPLAYWAAERAWGAVEISASVWPFLALGVAWALVTPLLLWLGDRWQPDAAARPAA
ncbi:DUF2878 domain-containing protein [Pseudomarimonas salicorniae]|uniref:DUF2878 domain-containing protein n=1 Tax=Pseudomarimonas salicorniae TaxID=2933270 RepID=A0ABT0GH41_9GAMM|nr:DUF2878 domain-containing protein [Lysobacter sp. CAU 1642]